MIRSAKTISIAAALLLSASLFTACGSGGNETPQITAATAAGDFAEVPTDGSFSDFDLTTIAEASRTSVLLEKYGSFRISYSMDYGEVYDQVMTFTGSADGGVSYISESGTDTEYFDGKNDYWYEMYDDGSGEGYANLVLDGAESGGDLEHYIFTYSEGDALTVTGYTRNDDGSYIISAAETFNNSYQDAEGATVSIAYKYEYVISANADLELTEMKSVCTDVNTGEIDSTLNVKVDYGVSDFQLPAYMNDTYELTVITIRDVDTETTDKFEVPTGFSTVFITPDDGDYVFSYDRSADAIISDTMEISEPGTVFAINSSKLAVDTGEDAE